jgi:hypothetical protein
MIKTKIIKLNVIDGFDNTYIENELTKLGYNIVRWALVEISDLYISVCVSYINIS